MLTQHKRRYLRRKQRMVDYKGGECAICGYNKCLDALDFHHTNPKEKSFALSNSYSRRWASVEAELDKCILLCSNCHRETHSELLNYNSNWNGDESHG